YFKSDGPDTDVTLALAVVHWLHSCTADYGSLRDVVHTLASKTKRVLLIEWIDPTDVAIQYFKHTDYNSAIKKAEYTYENFIVALTELFESVQFVSYTKSPTRKLFAAFRNIDDAIEFKRANLQ